MSERRKLRQRQEFLEPQEALASAHSAWSGSEASPMPDCPGEVWIRFQAYSQVSVLPLAE